jgi:hypothetical protein
MLRPTIGDRVVQADYGPGTITAIDIYHTVIDFDRLGQRRFVTNRVVLEATSDPGPSAAERKAIVDKRTRDERKRKREADRAAAAAAGVAEH